jgi:hypothetical protein
MNIKRTNIESILDWRGLFDDNQRGLLCSAGIGMTDPNDDGGPGAALVGLAFAAVVLAVGLWVAHAILAAERMQDCVVSGRTNCFENVPAQ